jgi:hypothetical protein
VLNRLLDWNRRRKQWNRDHVAAWAGQDVPGASGLSPFQERCEAELVALLRTRGLALQDRVVRGKSESYIHAKLADTLWQVWISLDQAELSGPGSAAINLEQWSVLTPDELVRKFLAHVQQGLDEVERQRGSAGAAQQ